MKKSCLLVIALVAMWGLTHMALGVKSAEAAGFHLFEWGNRGNAMGGAVIASQKAKPSALAYNPAGMTQLEGMQAQGGVTFIAPKADLTRIGEDTVTTKGKVYTVPHAYATYQINDSWWFGVGEFSRFGLGTNFDHDWGGAGNVYKASVESVSLQPTIAWKANDKLSLAFGAEIIAGRMDLRRNFTNPAIGQDYHMSPEGLAWSWIAAAQYNVTDKVSVGVTYRKGFVFNARGDFTMNGEYIDDMTVNAAFPGTFSVGISYEPTERLALEFDVVHTFWSDFNSMDFAFSQKIVDATSPLTISSTDSPSPKNYRDSTRLQFGAEYEAWDDIYLRAGYVHDPSPQNSDYMDYMLPANDRNLFSTGLGLDLGNYSLDFSYVYLISNDYVIDNNVGGIARTDVNNGVTQIGGMSVSYKF